jgi:hypothetical protein
VRRVILASILLSISVEILQVRAILGRDASLGDVLFNTLGGGLGVLAVSQVRGIIAGGNARVFWFPALLAVVWFFVAALGSLGFIPAPADALHAVVIPDSGDAVLPATPADPFLELNGVVFRDNSLIDANTVGILMAAPRSSLVFRGVSPAPASRYRTIVRLAPRAGSAFAFGQVGRAFHCARRVLASSFRLRTPTFVLSEAFPERSDSLRRPIELECSRERSRLRLRATHAGRTQVGELPLTPGLGWAFFARSEIPVEAGAVLWHNMAWLFALTLPLGVGVRIATQGVRRPAALARWGFSALLIILTLVLLPMFASATAAPWWELLASMAGFASGALLWTVFVGAAARVTPSSESAGDAT